MSSRNKIIIIVVAVALLGAAGWYVAGLFSKPPVGGLGGTAPAPASPVAALPFTESDYETALSSARLRYADAKLVRAAFVPANPPAQPDPAWEFLFVSPTHPGDGEQVLIPGPGSGSATAPAGGSSGAAAPIGGVNSGAAAPVSGGGGSGSGLAAIPGGGGSGSGSEAAVASDVSDVYYATCGDLPPNLISSDAAIGLAQAVPGYGQALFYSAELVCDQGSKTWYWGVKTELGTVTVKATP
jgi:hypothetical protein